MSWRVIDAKWDGIRDAFAGFEPTLVADYGQDDVERLLGDPRVVRSKAKIEATIDNAQTLLELDEEYGGFARYLRSHRSFEETVTDLGNGTTRIDHELEMRPKGLYKLMGPMLRSNGAKTVKETAAALQRRLEREG